MSLRNVINDFEYTTPQGLDTTSPIATVREGYVREAKNVNLGLSGGYVKRFGYENQLTSVAYGGTDPDDGTLDIIGGIEYRPSSTATRQVILYGTDGSGSGGRYGAIVAGAVSDISTGLSGTTRPGFVQFNDLLFFYNGVDSPELYDGTNVRQVGITEPADGSITGTGSAGGSKTSLARYILAYSYYNSNTGAESTPKLSAPVTLAGGENEIDLSFSAGDSSTADTIRIYSTVGNGNTLFLEAEISIASTTYTASAADSALGPRQIELDNTRITILSSTARFPTVADNRVFLQTATNEVRFSKIGQEGPMPESFEAKSFIKTVGRFGTNDNIVGINRINQLPIILKESSIGRLDPFGLPDVTNAVDNVGYTYREISDAVGAVSHDAACQVFNELIFLGRDNIYATNGLDVRPIANSIQASIRALGFTSAQKPKMSAINDVENRRIYIQVFANQSNPDPTLTLVGDYQLYPNFRWTTYEPGVNGTTHPGIQAACYFQVTSNSTGKLDVWFGNTLANGKVYKMNSSNADDELAIFMRLVTRPYFGNNPLQEKLYKKAELQARGDGNDYDVQICSIYNLSGVEEDCAALSLFADGALYDDVNALYDVSNYADESLKNLEYFMHRKAKYYQMIVKQTEANAPVDLFAWGIYSSGFGLNEGPRTNSND